MSRTVERARCLLARPGAWLGAEQGVYALRLGPDRRGRISLTLSEPEFRALIERPGLRRRPQGGWTARVGARRPRQGRARRPAAPASSRANAS
ncbi:hypothetical protein [Brevundimonas aurantiaca]|uniref:hypothetical protein n=1 Tax=Brevundimonas aurantiaca TaxID=74316 RepID=UPI002795F7D0|nr:hypothetical protein [Brevundimonas aurantiaca]